ncbi:glycosyl transferase family 2 [Firmicutes bacterium CAG:582]|nr:glycosyl transferase family 2 [Firmicutes bacterium CAG:582]
MKKNPKVLLIIPAYNEEKNILTVYKNICDYNKKAKTKLDVVFINDGSIDATEKILCENNINHIKLIQNLGIGGAVQTGYKYALYNDYDIAIQFDGDGQHNVNYVEALIKPILEENVDMTIGSRFIDSSSSEFKSSFLRRVGIKLISSCIHFKTRVRIYDTTSGFRASNKNAIAMFAIHYPLEYPEPISSVDVILSGMKIKEVPVSMNERLAGKSSINSWKNIYYMVNVVLSILLRKKGK